MKPHLYPPGKATGILKQDNTFSWEPVEWGKCSCGLFHSNRSIPQAFWNKPWTRRTKQREKVGIILIRDNKEIWVTQSYNNCFGFPKGEKEINENVLEGAAREFYEETGTSITLETLQECNTIRIKIRDIKYTFYIVKVPATFEITSYPIDDVEITSYGWKPINDVMSLKLSKAIQKIFGIYLHNRNSL